MSDYSNLFRGGGVTSARPSPGRGRGPRLLFSFVALCFISLALVWYFGFFSGEESAAKPVVNSSTSPAPSKPPETMKVEQPPEKAAEPPPPSLDAPTIPPKLSRELSSKLAKAKEFFQKEDYVNAADVALSIIDSGIPENTRLWNDAADLLGKANIKIFMSDMPAPQKKRYTIKSGDNLISIANKFGTTVEAVQKSNGLSPTDSIIYPGKTLYIYSGDWSVKVSRGKFKLYLYDHGKLFKVYKVGVGRQGRTPLGQFIIQNKRKNPVWYSNGRAIPYGDKANVLGTRWMALKPVGDTDKSLRGYGIHGTWEPESVGTQCSNGCVRMTNEDVNELFTILPYHTKVTIEE